MSENGAANQGKEEGKAETEGRIRVIDSWRDAEQVHTGGTGEVVIAVEGG